MNTKIIGVGGYVPAKILTNDDLSTMVDTNDEWIRTRTGINERRIASDEETSDMASKAALSVLKKTGVKAEDIDLIILATFTPDSYMPSTSCIVQEKIGAVNATCFDLSAACSGFIFAAITAQQFLSTGKFKNALVIGAEKISKVLDWKDRNTCVLFGDGAGAALMTSSEKTGFISTYTGSDGTGSKYLTCNNSITMDGREVFKFATKVVQSSINEVLKNSGLKIDDIRYIVPHQANYRIISYVAKKLGVDEKKFYLNLNKYANTSAASIPLALSEMDDLNLLKTGDKLILVGFGGGLTWGSILLEW